MRLSTSMPFALVFILHAGAIAGTIQERIDASEYEIRPNREGALQAPNRAHGFRTFFEPGRIHLGPRVENGSPWEWGLTWIAYGRGEQTSPVPEAVLSSSRARAEYRRGNLVEWYENAPKGLEQGFFLPSAPDGSSKLLHLDLALTGTLSPIVAADRQAIDFVAGNGKRVLRYEKLIVTDARGAKVRSWMEAFVRAGLRVIRLVLDADEAVFPLTVDPLTTNSMLTVENDQAGANLGASVATAGDVNGDGFSDFLVGVPFFDNGHTNEGQVRCFFGLPSGLVDEWSYEANVPGGALLGSSVATAGDVNGDGYADVIVGAPGFDNPENNEGRAYLFLGSAAGLSPTPAWTVESNLNIASYGSAVGTAGDVNGDGYSDVVVGAASAGRAYLYLGSPSGLSTVPVWEASSSSTSRFGAAVGTAGDVNGDGYADFLVGAPNYENGQTVEGAVFVYHGAAAGPAVTPAWMVESGHAGALYGTSVGTAGDVNGDGYADVVVGAPLYDNGQGDEGLAFVYLGSSAGLALAPAWFGESDQIAGHYGSSVGTAGDVNGDGYADVLVAGEQITSGESNEGRAWLYYGGPALAQAPAWTHETNQTGAGVKMALATAGDFNGDGFADVLVGFPAFDNGETDEGQLRLFLGSADGPALSAGWIVDGTQSLASFGQSVSDAGDVNGDGFSDVLVGAPLYDNGQTNEGWGSAYLGSGSGLSSTPAWSAEGDQSSVEFGFSLRSAGDVNGDGYADVIVGARFYTAGFNSQGRAYLFQGSASGIAATPAWTATVSQTVANFGYSVGSAGDVNGDGFADVLVGAPGVNGPTGRGAAYLYLGSASGLSGTPRWVAAPHVGDVNFGLVVAAAGDVNRDGYADVLVSAPAPTILPAGPSRIYLYLGSASGLPATHAWSIEDPVPHGFMAGTAGDVNGDGYADVFVSSPWYGNGQLEEGRVAVYPGTPAGLGSTPDWTVESDQPNARYGYGAAAAGDVNGDGYGDFVVGAPSHTAPPGTAWVYLGSAAGLATTAAWTGTGSSMESWFGHSAAGAGDVNGDGYADILVGAPRSSGTVSQQGRVLLYYGNGGPGATLIPAQTRSGDGVPIARGGASDGPAFRLRALGRTPFGRGRVRFETEVEGLNQTLDGLQTTLGSPTDTGTAGVSLQSLEENLSSGTPFHWRMRLRYDPATTPLASRSRWFTVPWGGWNEAMLRTPAEAPLGRAFGLTLTRAGSSVTADWSGGGSCLATDEAFALYEGALGAFTSHVPVTCSIAGGTWTFTPQAGNRYFVLVPTNSVAEGSYGLFGDGTERPPSAAACRPEQRIGVCP